MDDDQELSFKSFIEKTPEPAAVAEPAVPQPEVAVAAPVQDAGSVATEVDAATLTPEPVVQQPVATEPAAPEIPAAPPAVRFEDVIARKLGWKAPDDVDPESLYETVADQVAAAFQMRKDLEARDRELAELRAKFAQPAPTTPAAAAATVAEPAPVATPTPSRFGELSQPASSTRAYVIQDPSGAWVAKPEYAGSPAAFAAAEEWNKYEQAKAERANLLVTNPRALIDEASSEFEARAKQYAQEVVDQRLKSMEEDRAKQAAEVAAAAARQQQEQALAAFDSQHAAEFYHLDATGKPLLVFGTTEPIKTPFFQQFDAKYVELARKLPQADQLTLASLAYDFTKSQFGALAPQAPAATAARPAAPAAPAPTAADMRARFVEQRTAPAKAPGNMQPAPAEQMPPPPGNRFLDYLVQNQELEGNPVWDALRKRTA